VTETLTVEVVFASAESQVLLPIQLPPGATVADAIQVSKIQDRFPGFRLSELPVGIWGRVVTPEHALQSGDRVEIYRQLKIDPMTARRVRASAPDPDRSESH
jgi:putative ubiquitin-RnfH superfamily antitoxin RatB of RatAB toxin-antitoxin module